MWPARLTQRIFHCCYHGHSVLGYHSFLSTRLSQLHPNLQAIDGALEAVNVPYSYGFSIIVLTIVVKILTYPLSQKQVQSTVAMQALQPRVKELQAKYGDDKEALNVEIARMYQQAKVNPLAGCLPTLATIPVFIGLYRALTLAASDGLLKEGFFFIPSLAGPTSVEAQLANQGTAWLFPFVDGQPPLGWEDTAKYLVLPVLLVISQYVSMKISSPKTDDPQAQQAQQILKFLPIMIGELAPSLVTMSFGIHACV
jgi:YidC/Oxa1 family membrane protein insertase